MIFIALVFLEHEPITAVFSIFFAPSVLISDEAVRCLARHVLDKSGVLDNPGDLNANF